MGPWTAAGATSPYDIACEAPPPPPSSNPFCAYKTEFNIDLLLVAARFFFDDAVVDKAGGKVGQGNIDAAQEVNFAETAFLRRLSGKGRYHLRWFTPQNEINLCGHATLASAFVAFTCLGDGETEGIDTLLFDSLSGPLSVRRVKDGPYPMTLELDFPAWKLESINTTDIPIALLSGLGLSVDNPPLFVGKNRDYLVVLSSPQAVLDVVPNFAVLAQVKDAVVIIIAAAGDGQIHPSEGSARGVFGDLAPDFVVRAFCPDCTSVPEDPVCGSAHCSLIPYFANVLKRNKMLSHQVSRRGGQLMVELSEGGERVKIAGTATLFMSGVTDCVVEF